MRVAVVGAGVSGLAAALSLSRAGLHVVLFEKDSHLGGHAHTVHVDDPHSSTTTSLDLGFMVFNRVTYPNMLTLFDEMDVPVEDSDMSFSVSLDGGRGWEWSSNGLSGLFAQKRNLFNPRFLRMISEIVKFKEDVLQYLDGVEKRGDKSSANDTLGHFLQSMGYSEQFISCYLVPVCASIWSCSAEHILQSSAVAILKFCKNHHLLQIFGRPQWLTVKGRSQTYVQKLVAELNANGSEIRTNTTVTQVTSSEQGISVIDAEGNIDIFDQCIIGAHAPDALKMLGPNATDDEHRILGAFKYSNSDVYLHRDAEWMPKNTAAWCAWNFLGCEGNKVCVTYWLNKLQNLGDTGRPFLVTLNPPHPLRDPILIWHTSHPIPSLASVAAAKQMHSIQGKRGIWFCGAYEGNGFHEDGLKSGLSAANGLLGRRFKPLTVMEYRSTSIMEFASRFMVRSFLQQYIQRGYLELQEAGGPSIIFGDQNQKSKTFKCVLHIHRYAFYWKIATRGDLGLADAYIDGDFTCADSGLGLLNLFMILIDNRDHQNQTRQQAYSRGWWSPMLFTSIIGSASSYARHLLRGNSLTNARRNIAAHYDLSNDFFSLFLDETMTYSCAIFKNPTDSLKEAQLRKIHHIINKAQIDQTHEVLEIGFGWGSMALEVVKLTGCKYTGITLSEEQLKLARERVRDAGLEDKITLELCDYRTLTGYHKYDRIISCEMLEAVGHENFQVFFRRCDHLLAKDGLMVVQVITIPEERYDEYRKSSDFIKEYIFPGGCLPAFSTLTAAMSAASSICVEHVENIGVHYYPTLMAWRNNLHEKCSEIARLGFGEKFLRMWDYYFVYCAAGFKSCTLGDLQIVFSRPGNMTALGRAF